MELIREHFRAIIFHNFRCGLSRQECIDDVDCHDKNVLMNLNFYMAIKQYEKLV